MCGTRWDYENIASFEPAINNKKTLICTKFPVVVFHGNKATCI